MQSPADLQPTFVITRDGDVYLYKTVARASSGMEAIDVRDGEYEGAFGIDGERLEILTDGHGVRLEATGRYDLPRLQDRLRALAERNGYSGDNPDPRAVANEVFANQWQARWPRWPRWLDQRLHDDGPPRV